MSNTVKNVDILATSLSVLHKYFNCSTKCKEKNWEGHSICII